MTAPARHRQTLGVAGRSRTRCRPCLEETTEPSDRLPTVSERAGARAEAGFSVGGACRA